MKAGKRNLRWEGFVEKVGFEPYIAYRLTDRQTDGQARLIKPLSLSPVAA